MTKITRRSLAVLAAAAAIAVVAAGTSTPAVATKSSGTAAGSWAETLRKARGQTVNFYMWGGSDAINTYVVKWAGTQAKKYGVKVKQIPLTDTVDAINKVLGEKQAGRNKNGSVDLIWVNGENFRTGKQARIWFCGYTQQLPNARYINWKQPSIANDFGTPTAGCEVPWGHAQFTMVYNSATVPNPPRSMAALISWIKAHPGRFTYPAPPDFTGSVFVRHVFYNAAGGYQKLLGPFNQATYNSVAPKAWSIFKSIKPALWRGGATYPQTKAQLDQLYQNTEVDMTMTYGPGEVGGQVAKGLFPKTTREFVFNEGTIGNTHYTAIPYNAAHKEAAMVLQNILISREGQYEKNKPSGWGDYPAIDLTRIGKAWARKFASIPTPPSVLPYAKLVKNANPELQAAWVTRIENGWKQNVLQQ
jgi:putative spermidine/putrescine transport system substrate-binding protein